MTTDKPPLLMREAFPEPVVVRNDDHVIMDWRWTPELGLETKTRVHRLGRIPVTANTRPPVTRDVNRRP